MALFRKIVDEIPAVPVIDTLYLTGLGETLLDPHLIERLRYVRKVLPQIPLILFTNGSKLTHDLTDQFVDLGLTKLYVSINAANREKRRMLMGLDDYEYVVEQVMYALRRGHGRMTTYAKLIGEKSLIEGPELQAFVEQWGGLYQQGGNAFVHLEGNWAGKTWPMRITPITACDRALGQIMVLWDGRVTGCCHMGEGELILGDLHTQTIREVYNGADHVAFRRAHAEGRRHTIPPCAGCSTI